MAELTIDPTTIRKALDDFVESYKPSDTPTQEVGYVATAGDGIAHVTGLPGCMANELLTFEDGTLGLAFNLDAREIGVVILGDFAGIEEGQEVRRTGEVLSVPVGDGYLGRVVDPLGNPIDGLGEIKTEGRRILEAQAPDVMHRHPVDEPMSTGLKAIDAMTPIGRGQRQLIIGDRQTGKTAIAIDTIINQKRNWESGDPKKQVRCIYVAIGQKGSTIASVKQSLEEAGAMEYTTIVASPASDSAGFKYIAPYTGSAIGQHWMYNGKHVLIVFDDLSKQAEAYRSISLLLRRPPGREAYPGDVFYLHSRLLERCAKVSDDLGGGSMTGLPIVETKANDVSAYIPTNVISITDGQIFLQSDLFNANQRPAVDVGISVSRVGGAAQTKALKKVSGTLKISLAQYRSLESFAMFASDLDAASKAQLNRGSHLTELLKQPQFSPYSMEQEVVSVWAGTHGKMDDLPLGDVLPFEKAMLDYLDHNTDILKTIRETEDFTADTEAALDKAVEAFRETFVTSAGKPLVEKKPDVKNATPVEQEKIVAGEKCFMGSQLALKSRIASTASLEKIFNAQEMIASSHIAKARDVALNAKPYTDAIFDVVQALVAHTHIDHPIVKKDEDNPRVAVLALTSDRGMAGPYTSSIIRETESLLARLDAAGKQPELYVYGRRGVTYYKYRNRDVAGTWEGDTDQPGVEVAESISKALMDAYMKPADQGGVSELYIVFTEFVNMVVQKVRVLRMLPVELVLPEQQGSGPVSESDADAATPLYAFEPNVDEVLDAILPKYIQSRIHECLLTAAASETASRQNAMHTATDNARSLIDDLTRKLNASRQASITQELTEIIGSADALNKKEE